MSDSSEEAFVTRHMLWEAIKDLRVTSQRDLEYIQRLEKQLAYWQDKVGHLESKLEELTTIYNLHLHNLHGVTLQSP